MADGDRVATEAREIPDRLFFRIGDVSELTGVETHVLRFWESKFPALSPKKTSNGQRQYRRKDVFTVLAIKRLLYEEKYTIAGARKALADRAGKKREPLTAAQGGNPPASAPASKIDPAALAAIKKELRAILDLLQDENEEGARPKR